MAFVYTCTLDQVLLGNELGLASFIDQKAEGTYIIEYWQGHG